MGVEIPPEQVPHIQKELIRKCNQACKPVITATQMLDSMIRNPRPTRAEVGDVANAVYDGPMLLAFRERLQWVSIPIEALKMMAQICETTEQFLDYNAYRQRKVSAENEHNISNAVCYSSVATAHDLKAKVIIGSDDHRIHDPPALQVETGSSDHRSVSERNDRSPDAVILGRKAV